MRDLSGAQFADDQGVSRGLEARPEWRTRAVRPEKKGESADFEPDDITARQNDLCRCDSHQGWLAGDRSAGVHERRWQLWRTSEDDFLEADKGLFAELRAASILLPSSPMPPDGGVDEKAYQRTSRVGDLPSLSLMYKLSAGLE